MTKTIELNSNTWLLAESEIQNPYLTVVKFVFADDQPNRNKQAIPYEEFDTLAQSAIGMPIKIRFLGRSIGNHTGSIPVGHIRDMTKETVGEVHQLVAEGVLYNDEYPEVVDFLKEAFASGDAPGLSWELTYSDSIIEKGVTWLKDVIARAATFVKNPAYGTRTALLALASDKTLSDEDVEKEVIGMARAIEAEDHNQGGKNTMELEQALARIKDLEAQLAEKETALATAKAEAETVRTEAATLKTANDELVSKVGTFEKTALVTNRTKKVVEAGVPVPSDEQELTKKQEAWAALSEEQFEMYVSDLAAVAKLIPEKKEARASASVLQLPKISVDTSTNNGAVSAEGLRGRMRSIARNETPAE